VRNEEIKDKCLIMILHASLPASEQRQVFLRATLPKVILSTNIAESSITLPDVGTVIDLCIAKFLTVDEESTMASLKLDWISKHSCQQRSGRTGRVCDGKVFRMIHKRFFDDYILNETEPEIMRVPLETTILRIKMFDSVTENPITMLNKCMDTPKIEAVLNSILILKEAGGLHTCDENEVFVYTDGDLTYQGRIMASIPIDVRLTKLLIFGYIFNVLDDAIIIAAGLSLNSIFQNRYNKKMEDYKMKLKMANGSACDALTMLNAYKLWLNKAQGGQFRDWESEEKWCSENILERKNLHEMRQLIHEIKKRLGDLKLESVGMNWFEHEIPFILKVCIAAAFYPNYFMLGISDPYVEREVYKGLLGLDPNRTVFYRNMKSNQIGEVYIDQIKKKLVESKFVESSDGVKISFDSSKIFVQLPDTAMIDVEDSEEKNDFVIPGKILPQIYEGVKSRKLNLAKEASQRPRFHKNELITTIKLRVMPHHQTREYAVELGFASIVNDRVKLNKPLYIYPKYCVLPTYAQKYANGRVTHVDHVGNFFFQVDDDANMLIKIQQHFQCQEMNNAKIEKGKIVVLYHEENFNRGKIVRIFDDSADCYFFDFGFTRKIMFGEIYEVLEEDIETVFGIPERGFHCKLSKIEPSYVRCPRGKWTKQAIKCFEDAVLNVEAKIEIFSYVNDVASVELFIENANVNNYLTGLKYAVLCEEPYVNRLNNNERENLQLSMQNLPPREVEFKETQNKMMSFEIPHPAERLCTENIFLEGPFSPLETNICGIAENSIGMAKIDQFSVNSVQLDICVENYEGQLLIAADVVKNPPNEPTLHGVTAMPNIRGLPALLMMMFAPKTIFECDKKFERILSVKSNIGYDDSNDPFFVNHECSANVNFEIDLEDCNNINELRFVMSCLLKVKHNERVPELDVTEKRDLMQKAKDIMMKILQRDRKEIKLEKNQEGLFVDSNGLIHKLQNREFAFNQIEFPKFFENNL
jgi:ATP-dependent RNA helicase TDRD9